MSVPDADVAEETMWEGRFVAAKRRGRWEYVSRTRGLQAAVVLAIDDGHVLLVDQYRVPLGRRCLELPAGLVGDDDPDESIETAAVRELEEETGYRAGRIEALGDFGSSPGMVSEYFTLFRATELTKVAAGGGVEGEGITVHRVPLGGVADYVKERRAEGMAIDVRMLLVLGAGMIAGE